MSIAWREIDEKQQAFEADPKNFVGLLSRVSKGETPLEVATSLGLAWYAISAWVNESKDRTAAMQEALAHRVDFLRQRIERELSDIAFVDVRTMFGENHELLPISAWPRALGAAVAGLDVEDLFDDVAGESDGVKQEKILIGHLKKLKLWDKMKAMDMLGKQQGMFTQKIEHSGKLALESVLDGSWEPAGGPKDATGKG